MKKKILSVILSLAMLISMMPISTMSASAASLAPTTGSLLLSVPMLIDGSLNAPWTTTFTVTGPNGYEKTIKYADFMADQQYMLSDLPAGDYTVTESGAERDGYDLAVSYTTNGAVTTANVFPVSGGADTVVTVNHTYTMKANQTGNLTLVVADSNSMVKTPESTYYIITDATGKEVTAVKYTSFTNGQFTVQNLPVGEYTVTQYGAEVEGYQLRTLYTSGNLTTNTVTIAPNQTGTVMINNMYEPTGMKPGEGMVYIYVNLLTDDGINMPKDAVIIFTNERTGDQITVRYGDFMMDGKTTITMPEGGYLVKIDEAEIDGYTRNTTILVDDKEDNRVAVTSDKNTTVTINTSYTSNVKAGTLAVFASSWTAGVAIPATATFTVTGPNGYEKSFTYKDIVTNSSNGYYLHDLPVGDYTVTQDGAEVDGYGLSTRYLVGNVETATATVRESVTTTVNIFDTYTKVAQGTATLLIDVIPTMTDITLPASTQYKLTDQYGNSMMFGLKDMDISEDGFYRYYAENLEDGIYSLTQIGAERDGYTLAIDIGGSAVESADLTVGIAKLNVVAGRDNTVKFYNFYTPKTATGTMSVKITSQTENVDVPSDATYIVTDAWGNQQTFTYKDLVAAGGYYRLDLPVGEYTVTQTGAEIAGYTLATSLWVDDVVSDLANSTVRVVIKDGVQTYVSIYNTYTKNDVATGNLSIFVSTWTSGVKLPETTMLTITGPNGFVQRVSYEELADAGLRYTLRGVPVGVYTVAESGADLEGYTLDVSYLVGNKTTATATVRENRSTTMNIFNSYTKIKVSGALTLSVPVAADNSIAPPDSTFFVVTGPDGYKNEIAYADFGTGQQYTLTDLQVGEYTVREVNAARKGYTLTTSYQLPSGEETNVVTVTENSESVLNILNTYVKDVATGILTLFVPMAMDDGINAPDSTTFTVTGPNGYEKVIPYSDFMILQWYALNGLPVGDYTVTVKNAEWEGYTLETTYTVNNQETNVATVNANRNVTMIITNAYTPAETPVGNLAIYVPLVSDDGINAPDTARFVLTSYDTGEQWEVRYGDFMKNETYTFTDLPQGTYLLKELDAERDGYTLSTMYMQSYGEDNTVKIVAGKTTEMTITNTYEPTVDTGSLLLYVPMQDRDGWEAMQNSVEFVIEGEQGAWKCTYSEFNVNQWYRLTDIPAGSYTVTMYGGQREGYTLETTYVVDNQQTQQVEVVAGAQAMMTIQNAYIRTQDVGDLSINLVLDDTAMSVLPESAVLQVIRNGVSVADLKMSLFELGNYILKDIEPGEYVLKLAYADVDGYDLVTNIPGPAVVRAGETAIVDVMPVYTPHAVGTLTLLAVGKTNDGDMAMPKDTLFTVTDSRGKIWTVPISDFTNGYYVLQNMPYGEYTVEQSNAEVAGYNLETTYIVNNQETNVTTISASAYGYVSIYNLYTSAAEQTGSILLYVPQMDDNPVPIPDSASVVVSDFNGKTWTVKYGEFQSNGEYLLEGLPLGDYIVQMSNADVDGYKLITNYQTVAGSDNAGFVSLGQGSERGSITIRNEYVKSGSYTGDLTIFVTPMTAGNVDVPAGTYFLVRNFGDYAVEIPYSSFENRQYTLKDLPIGDYTVEEFNADVSGYTLTTTYYVRGNDVTGHNLITLGPDNDTMTVVNRYEADVNDNNSLMLYVPPLTDDGVNPPNTTAYVITDSRGNEWRVNYAAFSSDGRYTLQHLPTGDYTVNQVDAEREGYSLTSTYRANGEPGNTVHVDPTYVATVTVINTYTMTNSLVMYVSPTAMDNLVMPDSTVFVITDAKGNQWEAKYSDFSQTAGSSYDRYVLRGLPAGGYTIGVQGADIDGYDRTTVFSVNGIATTSFDVTADRAVEMVISTAYTQSEKKTGSLYFLIPEVADGNHLPDSAVFVIAGTDGYRQEIAYRDLLASNNTVTLPEGSYAIELINADIDGYKLTTSYIVDGQQTNVVNITEGGHDVWVNFAYTRVDTLMLYIPNVTMDGPALPDTTTFVVTGADGNVWKVSLADFQNGGESLFRTYALKHLSAGEYTVTIEGADIDGYTRTTLFTVGDLVTNIATLTKEGSVGMVIATSYEKAEEPVKTGSLTLNMPLLMDNGINAPDTAILTVTGPDGNKREIAYSEFMNAQSITLTDLAVGEYTVELTNAERSGYNLSTAYTVNGEQTNVVNVTENANASMTIQPTYTAQNGGNINVEQIKDAINVLLNVLNQYFYDLLKQLIQYK